MVTRRELEEYRSAKREVMELRAKARQAEMSGTDSISVRETMALYNALAEERADELVRIELEIDALASADQRRAVRMRYVDGLSRVQVAARMHLSEAMVDKHVAAAIREMERE